MRNAGRTTVELTVTDKSMSPIAVYDDFTLDMACGYCDDAENDFTLTLPKTPSGAGIGSMIHILGTEWGGIVDSVRTDVVDGTGTVSLLGRTWTGLLASKILQPDSGQDYLKYKGQVKDAIPWLINRIGLGQAFTAGVCDGAVNYQFDRYCDAYDGLRKMLATINMRPTFTSTGRTVLLGCEPITSYGGVNDPTIMDFTITNKAHAVNHLICLGSGELHARLRLDLYADKSGNISEKQTFTGLEEHAEIYDYTNATIDELRKDGTKKLADLQTKSEIKATTSTTLDAQLGDRLTGIDAEHGIKCTAEIQKKILKISNGVTETDYELAAIN